ncbi:MAG: hypothetical protein AB7F65_05165 [Dehalococcoidia bacterium]
MSLDASETSEATLLDSARETPEAPERFEPTPLRAGEARDDSALLAPATWLLLVVRRREDGRYLLVRRDESAPTMLSTWPPHPDEGLEAGVASLLRTHLRVTVASPPRVSETKRPARMGHPYTGGPTMGLLRAVAVEVTGEPEADALFAGCEALSAGEAEAALATDLERAIFRDGVALLD